MIVQTLKKKHSIFGKNLQEKMRVFFQSLDHNNSKTTWQKKNLIMNPSRFPDMASLEFTSSSILVLYQDTGQKQQVSKASSIKTHVTQFKSAVIEMKKWKLAVRFYMCSWPHKALKFHTWHWTGTVKGWSIQYLRITCSLLPSHQALFFVHCFTY